MLRRVVILLFFTCSVLKLSAQVLDSVQSLAGVEIQAEKISVFSVGLKIEKIDSVALSIHQGASIAELLNEGTPVSMRSYSPGGISTLTMRGTNSAQSGVFWNGINLQQSNMGMTDLSRISSFEFSNVSIQSGGASALLGSGVIGGSLHLANTISFSSPLRVSASVSGESYGNASAGLKVSSGTSKLAYTGSLSGDYDKNNFSYTTFSGERERLEHALSKSLSTIHEAEYILSPKQRLTAGFWYQETDRQIPPTMTMSSSDQQQWDRAIRSSMQWAYTGARHSFMARSAFINEKEHYQSTIALIDAFYNLNTFQAEFEYKQHLGEQFSLGSGATCHIIHADVPYYAGIEYQPEGSVWLALAFSHLVTGIKCALNLRQDFSKGYQVPFSPSLSAKMPVSRRISANFSVSRNFRVPTMNDKYWVPGGNPDLKPENNWNIEVGIEMYAPMGESCKSKIKIDVYSLVIDNMIQWVPGAYGIWSPQNVQKVWSRGIEISSKSDWKYSGFSGYFKLGYNYSPSTYRETVATEAEIIDNQLVYIPLHKLVEVFYISKGTCYAMFNYSLTGERYVNSNNTGSLPAYSLFDTYVGAIIKAKKVNLRLQAAVRNIFNTSYQSIQYYPEPGRSFSISVLISK